MPQFKYAGKSTQGGPQKGVIEAASAQAAAQALLSQNIVPLTIVESKKRSAENEGDGFDITRLFQQKVGLDEMIIFSRQMYSLLKAGIPIIRAIKGLSENASHKRFQEILYDEQPYTFLWKSRVAQAYSRRFAGVNWYPAGADVAEWWVDQDDRIYQ